MTVGYTPAGTRIVRKAGGRTKTGANNALRTKIREYEDGLSIAHTGSTVADALSDWLAYGLSGKSANTIGNYTVLSRTHIAPELGARKLRDLTAHDVDRWLAAKSMTLSTRTLPLLHSILNRSVNRAMARDKVMRNVASLCTVPHGLDGRRSESLTFEQAKALLDAAAGSSLHAYVVLSLMTGAPTEELRALTWAHIDSKGDRTPIRRSRPRSTPGAPCASTATPRPADRAARRRCPRAASRPSPTIANARVYPRVTHSSSPAQPAPSSTDNVLRAFRPIIKAAGLNPADWTPREPRHSFVSLLSDSGMSIEEIADLCGHSGTTITESVYRHQLRPVLLSGAVAMDRIFGPYDTQGS